MKVPGAGAFFEFVERLVSRDAIYRLARNDQSRRG